MRVADRFYELAIGQEHPLRVSKPLPWLTGLGHLGVRGAVPTETYDAIRSILLLLDGDEEALAGKARRAVAPDFLLGDVEVEFDEDQHFTIQRLAMFALYPSSAALGFQRAEYARLCLSTAKRAARAFAHRTAREFPGPDSRARQRAYLDAFRTS